MFFELIENSANSINIISFIGVYQNVIQVNNKINIQLFYQYFIDIFLKACWYFENIRQYQVILKMTVIDARRHFPLLFFANFHLIISACYVNLGELLSSIYLL